MQIIAFLKKPGWRSGCQAWLPNPGNSGAVEVVRQRQRYLVQQRSSFVWPAQQQDKNIYRQIIPSNPKEVAVVSVYFHIALMCFFGEKLVLGFSSFQPGPLNGLSWQHVICSLPLGISRVCFVDYQDEMFGAGFHLACGLLKKNHHLCQVVFEKNNSCVFQSWRGRAGSSLLSTTFNHC